MCGGGRALSVERQLVEQWHRARRIFDLDEMRRLGPALEAMVRGQLARGDLPSEQPLETLHRSRDPALHLAVAQAWAARVPWVPSRRPSARPERLRLCYISGEVGDFAVMGPIRTLFHHHDRGRFETTLVALNPNDGSDRRRWLAGTVDRFIDLSDVSEADRPTRLAALGADVVIDLSGWTRPDDVGLVAGFDAPVRVAFLGYPGSSGAPWIDYVVVDDVSLSGPLAGHFSERRIVLPGSFLPADASVPSRPERWRRTDFGLPAEGREGGPEKGPGEGVVFASFNSSRKLSTRFLRAVARILALVPGSVLWMLAETEDVRNNIVNALPAFEIDPVRVVFMPMIAYAANIDRQPLADLALDSLGYAGGATTGIALAAGVPVVTTAGPSLISRLSACQLVAAGFSNLVAEDDDGYVERAVSLGLDRECLADLRRRMAREVPCSRLCDIEGFARVLERGYDAAFERALNGEVPMDIRV